MTTPDAAPERLRTKLVGYFSLLTDVSMWKYALEPPRSGDYARWRVILCRFRGHPCGPIYYNPGGYEPDWECQNCGDFLG